MLFIKYVSKIIHFRCSKYIFVPTNYVKIRYYAASDKILVWYSGGVESDRNFSQNFNGKREIDILFVGRIDPVKGIDQVLDLLNENRVKNNKKKICIVGPQCIDYFASYEGGGVELHDSVPPNVVRRLMSQAKLVVIPSLNESFCLVAAESYLSGCNLLLNKLPALREIFLERQGVIFEERGAEFTRKALNHEYEPISTVERINLHKKINRSAMMERFKKCLY